MRLVALLGIASAFSPRPLPMLRARPLSVASARVPEGALRPRPRVRSLARRGVPSAPGVHVVAFDAPRLARGEYAALEYPEFERLPPTCRAVEAAVLADRNATAEENARLHAELPHSLLGVFFTEPSTEGGARMTRNLFLRKYKEVKDFPLLRLTAEGFEEVT